MYMTWWCKYMSAGYVDWCWLMNNDMWCYRFEFADGYWHDDIDVIWEIDILKEMSIVIREYESSVSIK